MICHIIKAFLLGIFGTGVVSFQQTNAAQNRYILAIPTNLVITMCTWFSIHYIISNSKQLFFSYGLGASIGAAIGIYWGNKFKKTYGKK